MIDRRTFSLTAAALAVTPGAVSAAPTRRSSRRAEAAALVAFAERTHPRGLEARLDPGWRALASRFVANADRGAVASYVVDAYRLLAWFKDGHTTLWASALDVGPFGWDMPIRAAAFFDGLYVTDSSPQYGALLGARITHVGGLGIDDLIQRFAAIWPANNIAWPHHDSNLLLTTPGFLHGLGAVRGPDGAPVSIEAIASSGAVRAQLTPARTAIGDRTKLARTLSPREQWTAEAKSGNYIRRLPDGRSLYVSLEDITLDPSDFLPFHRQILAAMAEPQAARLILDLRRNPGGNNFLIEPLRKEIGRSRFNRPGGLYVLTSPTTFSAAQNLANRLERETFAIFAGEPTGGAPRHYGDAKQFDFPGGILKGGVSTLPWFDSYPQDKRDWIMPDRLIPRLFADWAGGRDRVLEAVVADKVDEPNDEATMDRVFYWGRKSQSAQWKPFWLA